MPAIHFGYGHQRDWREYNVDTANASITPNYYESYGTQKVVFDGPNRVIIVDENVTELDIREDVYEAWKEWVRNPDLQINASYPAAIRGVGGDPISGTTDQFVGDIYFLFNGWRLAYDPRVVAVTGVLYSDDYATAYFFDETNKLETPELLSPIFPARVSSVVNTYEIAGAADASAIAAQVWSTVAASYDTAGTMGGLQNEIANISLAAGATPAEIVAEMDANSTSLANIISTTTNTNTIVQNISSDVDSINSNIITIDGTVDNINTTVNTIDTNVNDIETVVNSIDTELGLVAGDVTNIENIVTDTQSVVNQINANVANIENILTSSGGGLTVQQATQLRELYEVFGLDPSKPLVVTLDARTAGANISQSIATTASQTTVTRIP